jgi:hypothetical protein
MVALLDFCLIPFYMGCQAIQAHDATRGHRNTRFRANKMTADGELKDDEIEQLDLQQR